MFATHVPFKEAKESAVEDTKAKCRQVSCQDRKALKEALIEVLDEMRSKELVLDESSCHGCSRHLIKDVVRDCEKIFTLADLLTGYPVFSMTYALKILEVIQEVFMDIPNFEESLAPTFENSNGSVLQEEPNVNNWFDFETISLGIDSDPERQKQTHMELSCHIQLHIVRNV